MRGVTEKHGCEEAGLLELTLATWSAAIIGLLRHDACWRLFSVFLHLSTRVSLSSFLLHQLLDQPLCNQPCLFQSEQFGST